MIAYLHRFTVEPQVRAVYGEPVLSDSDGIAIEAAFPGESLVGDEKALFQAFARLAHDDNGVATDEPTYPVASGVTLTLSARELKALTSIPLARAYVATTAYATVRFRTKTASATYYWTGAAWALATLSGHWNTAAQLETGLLSWPYKELGFVVELNTTRATQTPVFYGVVVACEFAFVPTSVDDDLPQSQRDDLLHRTIVGALRSGPSYHGTEEFEADGDTTTLVYGEGFDRTIDVTNVTAVYDVTDDPGRNTELAGTWDGSTKVFTLDDPITDGHTIHVQFTYAPPVSFTGDADWYEDSLPAIVVTGPDQTATESPMQDLALVASDASQVYAVRAPDRQSFTFRLRFLADHPGEVDALRQSVRDWVEAGAARGGYGRTLLSAATGIPVHIELGETVATLDKRGDAYDEQVELVVRRWQELHPGSFAPIVTEIEVR